MKFVAKRYLLIIGILLLFSIPSILPLFKKGFFVTDDGEWMIIRLSAFYAALRDGQIPVRLLGRLNFGFGYPVATFLYPGIMYLGSIIHIFRISFTDSIKIIIAISLMGSTVFSYFWLSKIYNKSASIIGAIFYLYFPYHLYDTYNRGSIGEIFALLWIPFILWNIERRSLFFVSVGIGLVILSHNTLAALFIPIILVYMLIKVWKEKKYKSKLAYQYSISLITGIGLAGFFILPVLFELKLTNFSNTKISNPLEYFANFSLIGWLMIFIFLLASGIFIRVKNKVHNHTQIIFFIVVGVVALYFSSIYSNIFWSVIPSQFIQFPFRLLSIVMLAAAYLAAFITSSLKGIYRKIFILVSVILLAIPVYQQLATVRYTDKGDGFYGTNDATTTVHDEYMPIWVREKPTIKYRQKVEIVKGKGVISNLLVDNQKISFIINSTASKAFIHVNTIYWPGWSLYANSKPTEISHDNKQGLIAFSVPAGRSNILLKFEETPIRLTGDAVTIFSLIILIYTSRRTKNEQI